MRKTPALVFFLALLSASTFSQDVAQWHFETADEDPGDSTLVLVLRAELKKNWLVYSSVFSEDVGPIPTHLEVDGIELIGSLLPIRPQIKWDNLWNAELPFFTVHAEFRQRMKVNHSIRGKVVGQYCNSKNGQCIPFREQIKL